MLSATTYDNIHYVSQFITLTVSNCRKWYFTFHSYLQYFTLWIRNSALALVTSDQPIITLAMIHGIIAENKCASAVSPALACSAKVEYSPALIISTKVKSALN